MSDLNLSPWATGIKLLIIGGAFILMSVRDHEHIKDNVALSEAVYAQAQVIESMECGPEMIMPIEMEKARL